MSSIIIYPFESLGTADYGWLKPRYHFSFSNYYDPQKMGIGPLCVWNDDIIAPDSGFPMHSHDNMEIITYVKEGAITHEDSLGNKGITKAGDIQIMSAGTGIRHSEYNHETIETKLFQIWIRPNQNNILPRWETQTLHQNPDTPFQILATGHPSYQSQSKIHQDISLWRAVLSPNKLYSIPSQPESQLYGVLVEGLLTIQEQLIHPGDGFYIAPQKISDSISTIQKSQLIFIEIHSDTAQ